MYILGISAYYHDSACALLLNDEIVAAAEEERFTRIKHDASFPYNAIEYCLAEAEISIEDIEYIAFYDKPFLKFERLLETYLAFAPRGFISFCKAMPIWIREKIFLKNSLVKSFKYFNNSINVSSRLLFSEHHISHAASAFYPSPFLSAVVLTVDGVGEWTTTSISIGHGSNLKVVKELIFPDSLGLFYSAFTHYLGFKVNSGEYKVMGLAPYGKPVYKDLIINTLIDIKADGSFRLDQTYFDYCVGLKMISEKFIELFGHKSRNPDDPLTQFHFDIASSVQEVLEEVMLSITRSIREEYGLENLCIAGGVALNCVSNGKILIDGCFKNIWIQPASGDSGGALGAALAARYIHLGFSREVNATDSMKGSYLGIAYEQNEIESRLQSTGAVFEVLSEVEIIKLTAEALSEGNAVGWFQGRMEFGPRALGGRSILGDPRSPDMQSLLNLKVKFRESFRPFAPAILREDLAEWFKLDIDSPYMLFVSEVQDQKRLPNLNPADLHTGIEKLKELRTLIPAVTHVDFSARIQTVHNQTNPKFYKLLNEFKALTGCPILVNTSFNVRGEPIVCTPEDAFSCFMHTNIEYLVIGNCFLKKVNQDQGWIDRNKKVFELD